MRIELPELIENNVIEPTANPVVDLQPPTTPEIIEQTDDIGGVELSLNQFNFSGNCIILEHEKYCFTASNVGNIKRTN